MKKASFGKAQKTKLLNALAKCQGRKILVVGDVGIDRYTQGTVERISPEAPVPILRVTHETLKLGLAANVADNVAALGGTPYLVGLVGRDRGSQDFDALLKQSKISSKFLIHDSSRRTVLKERVVAERQQLVRIDYEDLHPVSGSIEAKIFFQIETLLPKVDALVVEDYAKGMISEHLLQKLVLLCRRLKKPLAIDPNLNTPIDHYQGATLLTPNTKEAEYLSGIQIHDDASLQQAGSIILSVTNTKHLVITRGKDGMAIFSQDEPKAKLIPTYAQDVFDVSGAGDTVISMLAMALGANIPLELSCLLANIAAGIEVGKWGTATVTPAEIRNELL